MKTMLFEQSLISFFAMFLVSTFEALKNISNTMKFHKRLKKEKKMRSKMNKNFSLEFPIFCNREFKVVKVMVEMGLNHSKISMLSEKEVRKYLTEVEDVNKIELEIYFLFERIIYFNSLLKNNVPNRKIFECSQEICNQVRLKLEKRFKIVQVEVNYSIEEASKKAIVSKVY